MPDLTPPPTLNPDERRIWGEYTRELLTLGLTARTNPARLLELVSATHQHQRATLLISQSDILIDRNGAPQPNPALAIQAQAAARMDRLRKELRLNRLPLAPDRPMAPGRYCEQHKRLECAGLTATGNQCHGSAVAGRDRCVKHCGVDLTRDPKHILALAREANPLDGEPMDIGPAEALLWRVQVIAGEVQRLDAKIRSIQSQELVWGKMTETSEDGPEGEPLVKTVNAARLNMWIILRDQRERALHMACEAALRAGVEAKLVDVFKEQAALIRVVLVKSLNRLGVSERDEAVQVVMGEVIAETLGLTG